MTTPKRTRSSARRGSHPIVTDLHRLPEGPAGWHLDDHTAVIAREGLAKAREALRLARLAVAEREEQLTGVAPHAAAA